MTVEQEQEKRPMQKTSIEYLTHTWNPIAMRCVPVSPGCANCWHLRTADRLCKNNSLPLNEREALAGEGPFVLRDRELTAPLRARKGAVIGVQFMGDLFHEAVPDEFRDQVYAVMTVCSQHAFIILTKRPERMAKYLNSHDGDREPESGCSTRRKIALHALDLSIESLMVNTKSTVGDEIIIDENGLKIFPPQNIYNGLTVCNQQELDDKWRWFSQVPGKKFLSLEPLLGPIDIEPCLPEHPDEIPYRLNYVSAVIVGGETLGGKPGREMKLEWAESVVEQCVAAGVPVFVKQLHINGKVSKDMGEWPENLRRRDLPWR